MAKKKINKNLVYQQLELIEMATKNINKKITPDQVLRKAWRSVRRGMLHPPFSGFTEHERNLWCEAFMLGHLVTAYQRNQITEQQLRNSLIKVQQELGLPTTGVI